MAGELSLVSKNKLAISLTGLIFLAYAIGRVITGVPSIDRPRELADTVAYLRISGQPIIGERFWADARPFVFPLLLKIAQQDTSLTAAIQLGLSILAWGVLAFMVSRNLQSFILRPIAFGLILAFSLDRHIAGWDFVMMTESLSISLFVLFLALGIWLLESWRPQKAAALVLSGFLLAFTRDTNAWLLMMLAGLILLAVLLKWTSRQAIVLVISFGVIFVLNLLDANRGLRWVFPLGNLIGQRVLPDESAVEFFKDCRMPVSPTLMELAGQFANTQERAMFEDPELGPFRTWLMDDAPGCYSRWLLADPIRSTNAVFQEFDRLVAFTEVDKYFSRAYDPLMPVRLGKLLYPERLAIWIWVLTSLAALAAIWKRLWSENLLWSAFVCLNMLVFPHLYLTWHGDAMAPERHALSVGVQLYLSFWVLILLLVEKGLAARNPKG